MSSESLAIKMEHSEHSTTVIPMSLDDDWYKDQRSLYYVPATVTEGRAGAMAQLVERGNGFEVGRRLVQEFEPQERGRSLSLLSQLLSPNWPTTGVYALPEALVILEKAVLDYDRSAATPLADEIKIAVMFKTLREPIRGH